MGLLVDGKWTDRWYDTRITGGRFVRQESRFRNDFILGQHLERQNEQPKADWPGRNDQSVRRLLENYRNDPESIEHRAASGKRRKTLAGCSGEGQAVLCVPTAKKTPIFIVSKPTSENREGCRMTYAITWAEWEEHADASIRPSCSVVISARRES